MQQLFTGEVKRGDGRGRGLGFPTANMAITTTADLAQGIWASWCRLQADMVWRRAALHIGPRPTFDDQRVSVELHILDFQDRDLYGEIIDFTLEKHVRDIMHFSSEAELRVAIAEDCERVRGILVTQP